MAPDFATAEIKSTTQAIGAEPKSGLKRGGRAVPSGLFQGVRWSSPHAMADTVAGMGPLDVGFSATLRDVDEAADFHS